MASSVNKAKALLRFIRVRSYEFDDPYTSKRLFTSLVKPISESSMVAWSPNYKCYIDSTESVQKVLTKFALQGLRWNVVVTLPPCEGRLSLFTLVTRYSWLGILFIIKVLSGECNSSFLLSEINFHIPAK